MMPYLDTPSSPTPIWLSFAIFHLPILPNATSSTQRYAYATRVLAVADSYLQVGGRAPTVL